MQSHDTQSSDVAIFWDYENCHASSQVSGYEVVSGIRNVAHRFGPVKHFKAYTETLDTRSLGSRSELQSSGVSLTDCPHNGGKNVTDQMIMVDMLAYAMDHPAPATIILISGDREFAYAVSVLRLRRYEVVVISLPLPGAHISLKSQASLYLDWNSEVLGYSNSSHLPGRVDPPTAPRNPFNFQSPSVGGSNYLPASETLYPRASQLPSKPEGAAAISGHNRGANYSGDPFSLLEVTPPEQKAVDQSIPVPVPASSSSEYPYRPPGLREPPEVVCVPAPGHPANVVPDVAKKHNIGAATTPIQSTSTLLPLPQVVDKDGGTIRTPVQSPRLHEVLDNNREITTPVQSSPPSSSSPVKLAQKHPKSAPPELCPAEFTPVEGCSITTAPVSLTRAPIRTEVNDNEDREWSIFSPKLLSQECIPPQVPETLASTPPSGSPIPPKYISIPNGKSREPDPPAAPINRLDAILASEEQSLKHIPSAFQPLVAVLLKHRAKGIAQPLRSMVAYELANSTYELGVTNFDILTSLAAQVNLIQMGGDGVHAWISLNCDSNISPGGEEPDFPIWIALVQQ
ncbi:DUF537-domain-containing protein [Mycena venus]|uniref:DUF537-domain-containing protein n=1 Tax=Mycena venus TaxID=2733690 RepID=A0A8H6XCD0_9AGAR|nr:DUF537-domain-containing protein [Mycena venus]